MKRMKVLLTVLAIAAVAFPALTMAAGSKSNTEETRCLTRAFHLEAADTTTVRYIALYTAALTDTSTTIGSHECAYTSYARVIVPRVTGATGWTVSGATCSNSAAITFPKATGGTETATYVGIWRKVGSTYTLMYWDDLTSGLAISTNVTPEIAAGALVITED
jgi:hypothetical protein